MIQTLLAQEELSAHEHADVVDRDDRFRTGHSPLIDAGGRQVGKLVFLRNVTASNAANRRDNMLDIGVTLGVGALLFCFFYRVIDRVEKRLAASQAEIKASEERFRSFVENLNDVLFALTPEGAFSYVSPQWQEAFGYELSETIGKPFLPFVHPDDVAGCLAFLQQVLTTGAKQSGVEYRVLRKDGSFVWYRANGSLVKDSVKGTLTFVGIGRDISERKQHEQALVTAQRELQSSFEEIMRKNLELQRSNRTRSEFLAAVSHELRTPLNAVIGFSELLKDGVAGPVNPQQRSFAQDIYDAGNKLLRLLNDILDFSRLDAGFERLELELVNADVWLAESVLPWRDRAQEKNLTFTLDIPLPLGTLWLDALKGRQIVVNLLANAVKFTPTGGTVTLSARRVAQAQAQAQAQARIVGEILPGAFASYLEIEVRDSGIGFSADMLPRLFEPFHQDDASLGRHYAGVGLGLALVKRLVDLHGGVVQAYNAADQGACVSVWLPWREGAAELLSPSCGGE